MGVLQTLVGLLDTVMWYMDHCVMEEPQSFLRALQYTLIQVNNKKVDFWACSQGDPWLDPTPRPAQSLLNLMLPKFNHGVVKNKPLLLTVSLVRKRSNVFPCIFHIN